MMKKGKTESTFGSPEKTVRYERPKSRKTGTNHLSGNAGADLVWNEDAERMVLRETGSSYAASAPPGPFSELENRTQNFAINIRAFIKRLPNTIANQEDIRQLVRASGSVGANYIEANESLGKKDFQMHIKISRKEAKESRCWLGLRDCGNAGLERSRSTLIQEATELMNIFGSIYRRSL